MREVDGLGQVESEDNLKKKNDAELTGLRGDDETDNGEKNNR